MLLVFVMVTMMRTTRRMVANMMMMMMMMRMRMRMRMRLRDIKLRNIRRIMMVMMKCAPNQRTML